MAVVVELGAKQALMYCAVHSIYDVQSGGYFCRNITTFRLENVVALDVVDWRNVVVAMR